MERKQTVRQMSSYGAGLMAFAIDMARAQAGLPLSDELDAAAVAEYEAHQADIAREGDGTLVALALAAEIAIDDQRLNRRATKDALAETQVALYRPGRVFA